MTKDDDIRQIVENALTQREAFNQVNLSRIAIHTHNGTDSPLIDANTLGNLPIRPRVYSTTSTASPTPDIDNYECYELTALATAPTFAQPIGTGFNFQSLIIRIKDNGTARALTWDASYVAGGVALPTTTVVSKILTLGFFYNTANSLNKWQLVALAQEA